MSERLENSQIETPWWHSLRCLVLVACAVLLIFAVVSIVALRLRVTDAEVQLDMCRRNGAQ